jgi:Predicted transcriptional regulator
LSDVDKLYVNALHQNIEVFYSHKSDFANNYLSDIQRALVTKNTLTISYKSGYKDEFTCGREVEPIGICFYSLGWHLIGFCRMRNQYRDFRIDRIADLKVNPEVFSDKEHLSVREYFEQMRYSSDLEEVVIRFDKTVCAKIVTSKYYYGFIDEVESGDSLEMTFVSGDLDYFSRWLLMYADAVQVVSSENLKLRFEQLVQSIISKAK